LDFIFHFCIFFFQAEDGIRDATVTGVQTCALPICAAAGVPGSTYDGTPTTDVINGTVASNFTVPAGAPLCRVFGAEIQGNTSVRSEERRVGKECRSRWCGGKSR